MSDATQERMGAAAATESVSFRPDVFETEPLALVGSLCIECKGRAFPARQVCPRCGAVDKMERVRLARSGTIYSFTVVRQAPPGVATPYVLAYVDLESDDVRVMTRIEGTEPEEVTIGMPVNLTARPVEGADSPDRVMFAFEPER